MLEVIEIASNRARLCAACAGAARCAAALIALAGCNGDAMAQGVPYRERPDGYRRETAGATERNIAPASSIITCWRYRGARPIARSCARRAMTLSAMPAVTDVTRSCCTGCGRNTQRGWPEHCRSPDRGYVPRPVANRMLDIMPSDKLIFNEYRKHGTCSGWASTATSILPGSS